MSSTLRWRGLAPAVTGSRGRTLKNFRNEVMMIAILIICTPLIALVVWGIVFDLKRRRRHDPLTSHNVGSAVTRARGNADARGASSQEPGGGMAAGPP